MLEVRDLVAGYGGVPVLRGVSLDVAAGEVVAVLGANGVGKTTLNRCLSGLIRPDAGSIRFEGTELVGRDAADIVAAGLIHVPEGRRIFPNMSVQENLELGSYRRARARRAANLARVFSIFPRLAERKRQFAGTLSGGEQQMVAIGRALMSRPKLICMDEPSMGLSPLFVEQVFDIIQEINKQGVTIFMVEQNASMALSIAHRAYVLQTGVVVLSGPAAEMKENEMIKQAYLGEMQVEAA